MSLCVLSKFLKVSLGGFTALCAIGAQSAWSAIGPSAALAPSFMQEPAVESVMPNGLVQNVERMFQARWADIETATQTPPTDISAELTTLKLSALRDLYDFAQMTIGGLVRAAEGAEEQAVLKDQLEDLLARWNLKVTSAMNALQERSMVLPDRGEHISSQDARAR